jgi:hypothetical protein
MGMLQGLLAATLLTGTMCRSRDAAVIEPIYHPLTGRLQLLKYDSNANGTVDTWSHMDGTRVLRIEIDADEDGKLDRWEYYDAAQRLEKTGTSRVNDGKEDAWLYATGTSSGRADVSTTRDGKANRFEFYENDALVRVEEDGNADGKIDKWEEYESGRLAAVAFDTLQRGTPDRRLVYAVDGSARLEVDQHGSGVFVAAGTAANQPASR